MPKAQRFPIEVMLRAMREVDNGVPVGVVCRKIGMVEKTFYRYRESTPAWRQRRRADYASSRRRTYGSKKLLSEQMLCQTPLRTDPVTPLKLTPSNCSVVGLRRAEKPSSFLLS